MERSLDGRAVPSINANLTAGIDLTKARRLPENLGIAFQGPVKVGPFDIAPDIAYPMLDAHNPHGRSNREVVRPFVNGADITGRPRGKWIIEFGDHLSREAAALYEAPFEYVRQQIQPLRTANRDRQRRENWWRLGRSGGDLRVAVESLTRYIATPRVSKHRIFIWVDPRTLPDSAVVAIAHHDDYTFGVLHSRVHELWALSMGTQLEDRPRYTPTTTFETFPFPRPFDEQREVIGAAARRLDELRKGWLDPPGASDEELAKRTLTNLYNEMPAWLRDAHATLDRAALTAYGWPPDISDDDLLARLLAANLHGARG